MRALYRSCTQCPAALLCRVSTMHVSCTCPKCGRHWQYFRLNGNRPSVGYCIRLPNNRCDDPELYWDKDGTCPRCAGFGLHLLPADLAWLGILDEADEAFFMDTEGDDLLQSGGQ